MSQVWEYVKIALMNIKSNKGRSILTMLGIIIGISSVIMIISIGNGVKSEINGELNDMAGGMIEVYVDNSKKDQQKIYFTQDDFDILAQKVEHIKGITPVYQMRGTAAANKGDFDATVSAGSAGLEFWPKDPIVKGHYFTEADYYAARKVCVLTESSAIALFGTTDVLGLNVDLDLYGISQELTVVGIRKDSDAKLLAMVNGTSTVTIEIPLTVLGNAYGWYIEDFSDVIIIGDSAEYSSDIAKQCISILEGRYNVRGQGIIQLQNFSDQLGQINTVLSYITLFVVFVAAISLLVGGIGVMNIMLVSVTERTREIGIRKALGARTNSIMLQFLSESAIITLMGGLIGIVIGVGGAVGICAVIGFTPGVHVSTVLGASLFSSAVGIFFGIYPAKKAAKLSPIEALRHE